MTQKITLIIDEIKNQRSYSINEICRKFKIDRRTLKKYLNNYIEIRSKKNKFWGKKRKTITLKEKYKNAFEVWYDDMDFDQIEFMTEYLLNKPI